MCSHVYDPRCNGSVHSFSAVDPAKRSGDHVCKRCGDRRPYIAVLSYYEGIRDGNRLSFVGKMIGNEFRLWYGRLACAVDHALRIGSKPVCSECGRKFTACRGVHV